MIRKLKKADESAALGVAGAVGLFDDEQLELLRSLYSSVESEREGAPFWLGFFKASLVGILYCEPERMTHGTWNLQLIAVHPAFQKHQIGTALVRETEAVVTSLGGRLLIVETAGIDEFEPVREFYRKLGFSKEGTIRDFYVDGVDKVVFRKRLEIPSA